MLLLGLVCLPCAFGQDEKEPEQLISFEAINAGILRIFPEAYEDFMTISFIRRNEFIFPEAASFMIPDQYFKKKKLNQKELEKRAALLMDQLELSPACQTISFGEPEEYAWQEWDDKTVRKVTLSFGIGC